MGLFNWLSPSIHILAGEKVCIQVIRPMHAGEELADIHKPVISSGVVATGLYIILIGISFDALRDFTISWECSATFFNVSGPYRSWLPVINQASSFLRSNIYLLFSVIITLLKLVNSSINYVIIPGKVKMVKWLYG
jgi:hypothetical protein